MQWKEVPGMRRWIVTVASLGFALAVLLSGCEDEIECPPPPAPDETPPCRIDDLSVDSVGPHWVRLVWTAPGDDDSTGQASAYDLRYSATSIDSATVEDVWEQMIQIEDLGTPDSAGTQETLLVVTSALHEIDPESSYWFAIRASDEEGNSSPISNVAAAQTPEDTVPPAPVLDLTAEEIDSLGRKVTLSWTSPGEDWDIGAAERYDIRYSTADLSDSTAWNNADTVDVSELNPKPAGSAEACTVTLEEPGKYYFALRTKDASGLWSDLSNVVTATIPAYLVVDPTGTYGYSKISDAVEAATEADTILVLAGEYRDVVTIEGKAVYIRGQGPETTSLICENDSTPGDEMVLAVADVSSGTVRIEGLRIVQGTISCGHGLKATAARLALANCILDRCGLGLYSGSDCTIDHLTVYKNPTMTCELQVPLVELSDGSSAQIANTLLGWAHTGVGCDATSSVSFTCCDLFGNTENCSGCEFVPGENGNISEDPLLIDPENADFHLAAGSPCLADSTCGLIGALGQGK